MSQTNILGKRPHAQSFYDYGQNRIQQKDKNKKKKGGNAYQK